MPYRVFLQSAMHSLQLTYAFLFFGFFFVDSLPNMDIQQFIFCSSLSASLSLPPFFHFPLPLPLPQPMECVEQ